VEYAAGVEARMNDDTRDRALALCEACVDALKEVR
jgi:hypothetical protein